MSSRPQPASRPSPAAAHAPPEDWGDHATWCWGPWRCHWRRLGAPEAPPLVLIHGFGSGSGHWRHNATTLADAGWCVFALDLIGFGASSQPGGRLDNRLWARQLERFLAEVVQRPAVLVGHSLGALVGLSCAVFFPQRVLAVVAAPLPDPTLLMPVSSRRPPWRRRLQRWLVTALCRLLPLELIVPLLAHSPLLALGIQSAYATPVIGDRGLHRVISRPARRPTAARSLRAMSIGMALRPRGGTAPALLKRVRQPLLLIWGDRDQLVPLRVATSILHLREEVPLAVLPGIGHCPHDEDPQAFHQVLIPWLQTIPQHRNGAGT
ncbi:MAG: alpha/beta fold hydrolase [Cyanobacteriota bacterium]